MVNSYKRKSEAEVRQAYQERMARWMRLGRIGKLIYGKLALYDISEDMTMPVEIRVKAGDLYVDVQRLQEAYAKELHVKKYSD